MKKIISTLLVFAAFIAVPAVVSAAIANTNLNVNTSVNSSANTNANSGKTNTSGNASVGASGSAQVGGNASGTASGQGNSSSTVNSSNSNSNGPSMNATPTATSHSQANVNANASSSGKGSIQAEAHRSAVANFVKNVISIADREPGIGSQVRIIAQAQNASSNASITAMSRIENRGGLRTFMFGSDYSNLRMLRTEATKTAERVNELRFLAARATDAQVRADLNAQIDAFVNSQTQMDQFVSEHERKFSLFGWLVRLFS